MSEDLKGTLFRSPQVIAEVQAQAQQRVAELLATAAATRGKPAEITSRPLRDRILLELYQRMAAEGTNLAAEQRAKALARKLGLEDDG